MNKWIIGGFVAGALLALSSKKKRQNKYSEADWVAATDKAFGPLSEEQKNLVRLLVQKYYAHGFEDPRNLAYILGGAAWHETGIRNIEENPQLWANKSYAQLDPVTNKRYFGRGPVQFTGANKYKSWSEKTGRDLYYYPEIIINDSNLAADIAIRALMGVEGASFTGKELPDYIVSTVPLTRAQLLSAYILAGSTMNGDMSQTSRTERANESLAILDNLGYF